MSFDVDELNDVSLKKMQNENEVLLTPGSVDIHILELAQMLKATGNYKKLTKHSVEDKNDDNVGDSQGMNDIDGDGTGVTVMNGDIRVDLKMVLLMAVDERLDALDRMDVYSNIGAARLDP
jgi:hypothetical protein